MLRQAFAWSKPGENNGNTATNGFTIAEAAALTEEEERRFVLAAEMRDMRSLHVNLCRAGRGGDFEHGQIATAIHKRHSPCAFSHARCFRLGLHHTRPWTVL